ncbi:MAG: hypothetical protein IJD01_05070, partial [Clostridia bacterium]|nr:hypothetical protein [Clostridia bacterium]
MMAFLLSGCGETATPSTEDQNVTSTPTQEMEGTAATGFDYKENDDGTITVCGYDGGILRNKEQNIAVVTYQGVFNYSTVNNLGASYAS